MAGPSEVSRLVQATMDGGTEAWNELVRRYAPLVMAVARSYQLAATDAQDVGPTLQRCLARLRETHAVRSYLTAGPGVGRGKAGDLRELTEVE